MLTGNKDTDLIILNKLDDKDLVNVCKTNNHANEVCKDQGFWLNRIQIKFPYLGLDILKKHKGKREWSSYYIKDLRKVNNPQPYLYDGAMNNRLDWVIIAVNKGADVKGRKNTAIIEASRKGHLDIVKYLIENGVDVKATDYDGVVNSPIRVASENGHLDIVKFLVENGADVHGDSISKAVRNKHLNVVKYLVKNGADVRTKNDEPIRLAIKNKYTDIVDYLVSKNVPDPRI